MARDIWVHRTARIVKDSDTGLSGRHRVDVCRHVIAKAHVHLAHAHTFYEMTYVVAGRGIHRVAGADTNLGPGSVYIIPPGVFHTVHIPRRMVWVNFLVKVEALPELFRGSEEMPALLALFYPPRAGGRLGATRFVLGGEALSQMNYFEKILTGQKKGPMATSDAVSRHVVMAVLHLWAHEWAREAPKPQRVPQRLEGTVGGVIQAVEKLLESGETLSLEKLERLTGAPAALLGTHFRRALGLGLGPYLVRRKIQRSLWLLSQGERMAHIASRLGFSDGAHYSRTFKELLGVSPREYLEGAVGNQKSLMGSRRLEPR